MPLRWLSANVLIMVLATVTGTLPATAQTPVVRDSAGVRIVENRAPAWGAGAGWRVEVEPVLSIGEEDGDDPYVLPNVRAASILSDGTVVVGTAWWGHGSRIFQLRYYDAQGEHLASAGRYGQGPGEFERPHGIHRMAGDSVLVHDRSRFAVFGPRGELGRTGRFGPATLAANTDTRLVSGLTVVGLQEARDATEVTRSGLRTVFHAVVLVDLDIGGVDTLGVLVPFDIGTAGFPLTIPFTLAGGTGHVAGGQGLVWIGSADDAEAKAYRDDGTLEVIARFPASPRPLDPDLVRRWREGPYEATVNDFERWGVDVRVHRAFPQGRHLPSTVPAYSSLLVDALGNLWVQGYALPGDAELWDVYDPTGIWQGTVEFPPEVTGCEPMELTYLMARCDTVFEIGDDYVLIRHFDEMRVQRVRVHRLVKP